MEKEALTALSTAAQQSAAVPSPCETAARLRAVEEALKDPANEPVQNGVDLILDVYKEKHSEKAERMGRREGNMLDIIIESHLDQAQKVNKLVLSIKKFIGKSKADDATKEKFFLDINFYVFQKLWPFFEKEGDTLSELDKSFADHLADLKAFITAKFLGFPASVTNETFTTHSLFSGTMEALKALEAPDSPYGKLQTIYKVYKNCNQILVDCGVVSSADALVNIFIFMIVQAEVKSVVSNIVFLNLFVLPEDRNGELFCYFVSFNLAYEYLEKIEPGSVLVKTPLDMKKEPRILRNRIPQSDYREILSVISGFTKKTDFTAMRAKSARKGLSIGLALSIPIAAVVGLTTLGLGSPLSMLIVGAGAGIGSACGAANPKELKKSFNEFNGYIENLNSTVLKEHGVFLVSPLVTNSFNNFFGISQNSARKVTHVKWIVKTLGSNCCGDPATAEEGKSPECISDGDEDAYTSEDSDNDTITTSTTTTTTTNNNNNIEKRGEGTNSDSETDCSTSNDESSEDYPDSGSDLEDSVLNFINFDFNKDKNRKMMPLQKSKSTTSLSRVSKNSESNSSGPMGSRVGASSFTGVIVVSSDPSREGFRHEPDSRCAEDGEVLHEGAVETLEAEDASDNSSDDDIGYDSTFASDIKMKLIQKR